MGRLQPARLSVTFMPGATRSGPITPRHYTLTHSDRTGDLFMSIGRTYDWPQISGWYTRFLRDEVLANWVMDQRGHTLNVHCHVSGGLVLGTAAWRDAIFRRELPLVLEAFRFGDRDLYKQHPGLDEATIQVHFHASQRRFDQVEHWGKPADYRLE
jgi:hypothetical protein